MAEEPGMTDVPSFKLLEPAVLSAKEAGDWQGVATLLAGVQAHPDHPWPLAAYWHLATALQHLGRLDEADGLYAVLRDRWPDRVIGWWGRIAVAKAREDWSVVAQGWRDCLERFPNEEVAGWRLGLVGALRRQGDVAAARTVAAGLRDRWPDDPAGWQLVAELAQQADDLDGAAVAWQSCLNRFPDRQSAVWWTRLAGVLHKLGRHAEAADACATLRARWPDDPSGWRLTAVYLSDAQDWPAALQAWQDCLDRFPDEHAISWWQGLALAQSRLRQTDAVAQTQSQIRARWPDHPAAWTELALTASAKGNWPQAARHWDNCRKRFDLRGDAVFLQRYSNALIHAGRSTEAAQWIAVLRHLAPDSKAWLVLRLDLLTAQGDARQAVRELQDLSGHPAFLEAFAPSRLTAVIYDAGLTRDAALALLKQWLGSDEAMKHIAAVYDLPAPDAERLQDPQRPQRAIPKRTDTAAEVRQRLRTLARDRTCERFDQVVASAILTLDRAGLTRLCQMAIRRFPASRARILLETTLNRSTIPASDPDQVFAHRWRNILPEAAISIAGQLAGRPWRRLVCAVMVCDEDEALPLFVDHHTKLGVTSFIIINNGSARHPSEVLVGRQAEITHVEAPFSFRAARHGMAWINEILELGLCDWLLFADSDELLVYPGSDEVKLPELLDHFDRRGETAMTALMVDVVDASLVQGGRASDKPEDHVIFSANHNMNGAVFPRWQRWLEGHLGPGIFSHDPNKTPLVKGSAGLRYTNNHYVTSCTPAETSGVFRHLKLFRDRDLINMPLAEVLDHPRVRGRAMYCVGRHVDLSGLAVESTFDPAILLDFSAERLRRLGYCRADPEWRRRLPAPAIADRRSPAADLRHDPFIWSDPELINFPLMNEPLPKVLAALGRLAEVGNRRVFRLLLTAQLERIGPPEVARAMVLFAAASWRRTAAAARMLSATRRAIADAGAAVALCDIADALSFRPKLALAVLDAVDHALPDHPEVARRRLNLLVTGGDAKACFGVLKGFVPSLEDGSVYNYLRLLEGTRDWAQYGDVMDKMLDLPNLRASPQQLLRINLFPDLETRRQLQRRLLARVEEGALTGQGGVIYLSLLHLLGETARLADGCKDLAAGLPATAAEYFRRLMAAKAGGPPMNRIWGLGLSKTGTTSMHDYCQSLGMLAAHWVNPVTRALVGREDADLFDVVSDTTVVHIARVSGIPAGRRLITTTRTYDAWAESFFTHFGANLFAKQPASFDAMREMLHTETPFRFGAEWSAIHIELYFRFRNLREAYDYHHDWTLSLSGQDHPHLILPLELPDAEKARKISTMVGRPDKVKPYPHANQRRGQ